MGGLKGQSGSGGFKKKNGCLCPRHLLLRQRDLGVVLIICRKLNQVKSGQKASAEENRREIRLTTYCKLFTRWRVNIFGIRFAVEAGRG